METRRQYPICRVWRLTDSIGILKPTLLLMNFYQVGLRPGAGTLSSRLNEWRLLRDHGMFRRSITACGCLAFGLLLLCQGVALPKPPELPAKTSGEGRVPLFPLGDEFRESDSRQPVDTPNVAPAPLPKLPICSDLPPFTPSWLPLTPEFFQLLLPAVEY